MSVKKLKITFNEAVLYCARKEATSWSTNNDKKNEINAIR